MLHRLPRPEQLLDGVADPLVELLPPGGVHRSLGSGRALLLVDGVDELVPAQRPAVRRWLRGLLAEYPKLRVVVTSRPGGAERGWLAGEGFAPPVLLERMSPLDVAAFCRRWHDAVREAAGRSAAVLPCGVEKLADYERTVRVRRRTRGTTASSCHGPTIVTARRSPEEPRPTASRSARCGRSGADRTGPAIRGTQRGGDDHPPAQRRDVPLRCGESDRHRVVGDEMAAAVENTRTPDVVREGAVSGRLTGGAHVWCSPGTVAVWVRTLGVFRRRWSYKMCGRRSRSCPLLVRMAQRPRIPGWLGCGGTKQPWRRGGS